MISAAFLDKGLSCPRGRARQTSQQRCAGARRFSWATARVASVRRSFTRRSMSCSIAVKYAFVCCHCGINCCSKQDAAGIITCQKGRLFQVKGNGMVRDVFNDNNIRLLQGAMGVAHGTLHDELINSTYSIKFGIRRPERRAPPRHSPSTSTAPTVSFWLTYEHAIIFPNSDARTKERQSEQFGRSAHVPRRRCAPPHQHGQRL